MPEDPTAEMFRQHLGSSFDAGGVVFELSEVQLMDPQPGAPRSEPFSLLFVGPAGQEQRTYALQHDALGRLDVFLVPIGPGRYEAIFN